MNITKGLSELAYCHNRIDCPRFTLHGKVWATFYPRCFTFFNCRVGKLFLRKWRGLRVRGRAMQQKIRAHKARLTPAEVDHLAQATLSKFKSRKIEVIALDRKHWSPVMGWIEARKP